MSGEPKTLTPERFQHRHPVEAIRFTGANASDIYKFLGWEVPGDRVRLDNKAGVMRLWTFPPIRAGDWLVRRPQPLHKSEAACRPSRYVVYTDVDFHATFEPVGVPVVARDEAAELRAAIAEWVAADAAYSEWMVLPVREDWTSGEAKARKARLEAAEARLRKEAP